MSQVSETTSDYSTEDLLAIARQAVQIEVQALSRVVDQINDTLVEVVHLVEGTRGKVLVTGSGTSSQIAKRMAHLMAVSGTPALFVHSMDALHGTVGAVQPQDMLIALSKTGESEEVITLCKLVKQRGCAVVGVGESPGSSLDGVSDVFVSLSTLDGADAGNTIAFGSTLVAALWGDAMTRTLMALHQWKLSDSLEIHPAGGVGKLAEAAKDGVGAKGA